MEHWPFWIGGIAIGVFVLVFLLVEGRLLGVSTGYVDACEAVTDGKARKSWRLPFLAGIIIGGAIAAATGTGLHLTTGMGMADGLMNLPLAGRAVLFTVGGVFVGLGARYAGGCTSGHGIVGVAQLAPSSLISMSAFMAGGFAVTNLLFRLLGN